MTARFDVSETGIPGLHVVTRKPRRDERGSFSRLFCPRELASAGWSRPVAQINQTFTARRGTVRGMHYQVPPVPERKLVSCLAGEVQDVVVDLRRGSPTFLTTFSRVLSGANNEALLIPEGCGHGFQALTDDVMLVYLHDAPYEPAAERGVSPFDPRLAITWPLAVTAISDRDGAFPLLSGDFRGIDL